MGKKRSRAHQVSKGERRPIDPRWGKEQRREIAGSITNLHNKLKAHMAGKNTVITIANPNTQETNKPFIKISGKEYFNRAGR